MVREETKAVVMWGSQLQGPFSLDSAVKYAKDLSAQGITAVVYKLIETHYFYAMKG